MIKTAHLAEAFNMPLEIHHGASPIMNWANLHVACAIPNCDWFEVLVPERVRLRPGPLPELADGMVVAPNEPGLGVEIDWDWVRANKVKL